MNVYKINQYWIAAENKNEAYYHFLEEEDNLEYCFDDGCDLDEGEQDTFTITIRRLKQKELIKKDIRCHNSDEDDCDICKDENDCVYLSIQDIIDDTPTDKFPIVVAKEE